MLLLNNQLEETQVRYKRATEKEQIHFAYSIRHRMCVLQGTRDMFHEYASRMIDQIHLLNQKIQTLEQQVYADNNAIYPSAIVTTSVRTEADTAHVQERPNINSGLISAQQQTSTTDIWFAKNDNRNTDILDSVQLSNTNLDGTCTTTKNKQ